MRTLAFIVVLAFFASCTGPQMLTHHKVSYEVTAEHEDQRSNAYLQKQQLGFEVRFKGDSFYAFYQYGNSQLQHYGLDVDTAILAIRYDKTRYVSYLGAGSIDQYLSLLLTI